ncbi:MAG: hypothetical protein ACK4HV_05455 [Parachlamydiaceae bacterium]
MKKLLILCLSVFSLFADSIGGVDYTLPNSSQYWQLKNQTEGGSFVTFMYVEKGVVNPTEFFAATATPKILDVTDLASIQKSFKKLYPNMVVEVKSLESKEGDNLYEWSGTLEGEEKLHGFGRAIITEDGTVLLTYQTQDIANLKAHKEKWLPVLKNASWKKNGDNKK